MKVTGWPAEIFLMQDIDRGLSKWFSTRLGARWQRESEMLTDRELQSLRNMGNEAEAAADEIAELRHVAAEHAAQADARIAELEAEVHNLNWALGTPGYEQMATPEDQAAHEVGVERVNAMLAKMAANKAEHDAMVKNAERYVFLRTRADEVPTRGLDVAWWQNESGTSIRGESLDAAIDAEIQRAALGPKA